jgi:large subunit ribosomal protein L25
VPANIYGSKNPPANLQVNEKEISNLLSHAVGENLLVEISIADGSNTASRTALIQEVQHEPISGRLIHIDFHEVSMNETIHTEVNVEPSGEADGVKNFGGLLEQSLRHITIECLPIDLPELIVVDVSSLGINKSLHVRDIPLPNGVKAISDPDLTVFLVSEPRVDAAAEESTAAQPEVIKEKKKEDGDAKK